VDFIPATLDEDGLGDEENTPFNRKASTLDGEGDEVAAYEDNADDKDFDTLCIRVLDYFLLFFILDQRVLHSCLYSSLFNEISDFCQWNLQPLIYFFPCCFACVYFKIAGVLHALAPKGNDK